MKKSKKIKVNWYARGGVIAKMGPYKNQIEAYAALMTTDGYPIKDAFVWAEKIK